MLAKLIFTDKVFRHQLSHPILRCISRPGCSYSFLSNMEELVLGLFIQFIYLIHYSTAQQKREERSKKVCVGFT